MTRFIGTTPLPPTREPVSDDELLARPGMVILLGKLRGDIPLDRDVERARERAAEQERDVA